MKNKTIITIGLLVSACFLQSCGNKNSDTTKDEMDHAMPGMAKSDSMNSDAMSMDHGMMQGMISTMDKMKDMKMTGDFDADFASMMIMHHQAAIDMSEVEVDKGTDAQIKSMAQTIITAQKAEIAHLETFVKNYKKRETKVGNVGMDNLSKSMEDMMDKMHNLPMTGNADKDFVVTMIVHHESAVAMAEDELKYGKQAPLKTMAHKVISDQTKEITDFKAWLANQK
jgi:uncharacterized protein (DUF305 family)